MSDSLSPSPIVPARPNTSRRAPQENATPSIPARPRKQAKSAENITTEGEPDANLGHPENSTSDSVKSENLKENSGTKTKATEPIVKDASEVPDIDTGYTGDILSEMVSEIYQNSPTQKHVEPEISEVTAEGLKVSDTVDDLRTKTVDSSIEPSSKNANLKVDKKSPEVQEYPVTKIDNSRPISSSVDSQTSSKVEPSTSPKENDSTALEIPDKQTFVKQNLVQEEIPVIPSRPGKQQNQDSDVKPHEGPKHETDVGDLTVDVPVSSDILDVSNKVPHSTKSIDEVENVKSDSKNVPEHTDNTAKKAGLPTGQSSQDDLHVKQKAETSDGEDSLDVGTIPQKQSSEGLSKSDPPCGTYPAIPKRPTRTNTPKIPSRPVKQKEGGAHEESIVTETSAKDSESLEKPSDTLTPTEKHYETVSEEGSNKKAPPPKPKKLSSKIAAFQQMFSQAPLEQTAHKPSPVERGKLSSGRADFASNLQNMMGRGLPLPGMANPEMMKKLSPAEPSKESESGEKPESAPSSSIARRARGPRGKRLPKSIQETKIEVEPRFQISVSDLWEVKLAKRDAVVTSPRKDESSDVDSEDRPSEENLRNKEEMPTNVAVEESKDKEEDNHTQLKDSETPGDEKTFSVKAGNYISESSPIEIVSEKIKPSSTSEYKEETDQHVKIQGNHTTIKPDDKEELSPIIKPSTTSPGKDKVEVGLQHKAESELPELKHDSEMLQGVDLKDQPASNKVQPATLTKDDYIKNDKQIGTVSGAKEDVDIQEV
ncbi:hypothetical protein JCM33374_g2094 [Metschnikowia sp. JCM 33374]|nr:hypothetical protein JCM33374_g2094 [Metschnikowia sp. JCM 33374]